MLSRLLLAEYETKVTIVAMTASNLHNALLRPAVIQILRASGFHAARPAALDAVTDFAVRYLNRLASSAAVIAFNLHNDNVPTMQDVRLALMDVGALAPQMGVTEELSRGTEVVNGEVVPFEDLRGIKAFIAWAQGDANKEIRRVAGFGSEDGGAELAAELGEEEDDYVIGESASFLEWTRQTLRDRGVNTG